MSAPFRRTKKLTAASMIVAFSSIGGAATAYAGGSHDGKVYDSDKEYEQTVDDWMSDKWAVSDWNHDDWKNDWDRNWKNDWKFDGKSVDHKQYDDRKHEDDKKFDRYEDKDRKDFDVTRT
jgi:hypothetical protein